MAKVTIECNRVLMSVCCSGLVLEKVCEYFYYYEKYKNTKDVPDMDIPTELSLELLIAADYLDGMWFSMCVLPRICH